MAKLLQMILCALSLLLPLGVGGRTLAADAGDTRRDYSFAVAMPGGAELTGVMMLKANADTVFASVVNEFGVKAFDAVYLSAAKKLKLHNVIGPMNKWYVRRTMAADLRFMLSAPLDQAPVEEKKRTVTCVGDTIRMVNRGRGITYTIVPLAR